MKRTMLAAGVLALLGFIVAASGLVPLRASSGHWKITLAILRFGMDRSIATHSLGIDVPPLDDPALIRPGGGHYELACRACHGAPGRGMPRVAAHMLPAPPDLAAHVRETNDPRKLFYVVKHGMKFTGMPAWPSPQRDDEVWGLVAFLLTLPDLDAAAYEEFVNPPAENPDRAAPMTLEGGPPAAARSCMPCHGQPGDAFPHLAGQRREYLHNALEAYANGARHSGTMEAVAAGLTPAEMRDLSAYFARLPREPRISTMENSDADGAALAIARGRSIAQDGIPHQRVPACAECHVTGGKRRKPAYPLLAGQPARYLEQQLVLFQEERRGGSEYAHLMRPVASRLTREQMRDVARYFASVQDAP